MELEWDAYLLYLYLLYITTFQLEAPTLVNNEFKISSLPAVFDFFDAKIINLCRW